MEKNLFAVVLGVSSGFGRACALALAGEGYNIIGVHLDRAAGMKAVDELKEELEAKGVQALFFNTNAADEKNRKDVIAKVTEHFNTLENAKVHVLIHSLAFGSLKPLVASTAEESLNQKQIEMTIDVMANSLIYWVQEFVWLGLFNEGGRILSMTSAGSSRVLPMYGAVSSAKAALESYGRQLALELAPRRITVNTIRAGVTDTPALRKIPGSEILIYNALMRNPNHRLTTPEEVAKAVTLICKPESQWINGTILGVDGGEDSVDLTWWKPEQA